MYKKYFEEQTMKNTIKKNLIIAVIIAMPFFMLFTGQWTMTTLLGIFVIAILAAIIVFIFRNKIYAAHALLHPEDSPYDYECSECGVDVPDNAKVCPKCGAILDEKV